MHALYQRMGAALRATGRPILYSLCQYGLHDVGEWGHLVGGSMWRTGGDTVEGDHWTAVAERFDVNGDPGLHGPGRWNDPDMMLVGLGTLDEHESRTHMTLWAISAAPLILGHDLRATDPAALEILTNRGVLAIDQDPLGVQGRPVVRTGSTEAWTKPLGDGSTAVALFNRGESAATIDVGWAELGVAAPAGVRDLWSGDELGAGLTGLSATLPRHGCALYRLRED
jgi:alpha-galactosidase